MSILSAGLIRPFSITLRLRVSSGSAFIARSLLPLSSAAIATLSFLIAVIPAAAQFHDGFEDGEFLTSPGWVGDVDRWQIGMLDGFALQSMGAALPDTIHLATESNAAFGTWRLTFAHAGVNLSSFNGARIFLVSDRSDARKGARGYYLQLGTNNSDMISLWRTDGDLGTDRTEIARSEKALVPGESSLVQLRVDRDVHGRFQVYVNDALVLSASDIRYVESAFFVIWVKHTAQGADAFFIDNVSFEPAVFDSPSVPRPDSADIVINEIRFDPVRGASEFIEVYNRRDKDVDLSHLRIRDDRSADIPITMMSTVVPPGGFAVLVQDSAAFASEFRSIPFVTVRNWPAMNNGGDAVVLSTPFATIDSLSYEGEIGIEGRSLERVDPDGETAMFNFAPSIDGFGSTPGERNSIYEVDVTPPGIRFVDQIKASTLDIHFDEAVRIETVDPASIHYGTPVSGIAPIAPEVVRIELTTTAVDPVLRVNEVRDRKGNTSGMLEAPVAFLAGRRELVINEIMYEPLTDRYDMLADQVEFIEFVNRSDRLISLTEFIRTRHVDESGNADTLRFGRPTSAVKPGGYVVVTAADSTEIRNAYQNVSPAERSIHVPAVGLTLLNSGDRLRIHNRSLTVIDEVDYTPSWHQPDLSNRRGTALERIDVDVLSSDPMNWSSSVSLDGATPWAPNSVRRQKTQLTFPSQ